MLALSLPRLKRAHEARLQEANLWRWSTRRHACSLSQLATQLKRHTTLILLLSRAESPR